MAELPLIFDEVAELYDQARPTYPPQMIEAVVCALQGTQGRILEIGCGTGQATLPFARQGYSVTALEPGRNLAALAAKNLAAFPLVDIKTTTFEDWPGAAGQYDLVLSATAFHWVSPEVRYVKSAQALTPSGRLALVWNNEAEDHSVLGREIQAVYNQHMPRNQAHPYATHHPGGRKAGRGTKTSVWHSEIEASGLFQSVSVLQFPWTQWYATEQYLQLLETFSDHRALTPDAKEELFGGIAAALERHGGGRRKPYLTVLYLAQVRSHFSSPTTFARVSPTALRLCGSHLSGVSPSVCQ